jgi:signal transduction histidine kinase
LVTAREEERRRLRRDLHDGLGPALAAMSFKLDAAANLARHDPDRSQALIAELKTQIQSFLADIRQIAYNLRPPALDELGLMALRDITRSRRRAALTLPCPSHRSGESLLPDARATTMSISMPRRGTVPSFRSG